MYLINITDGHLWELLQTLSENNHLSECSEKNRNTEAMRKSLCSELFDNSWQEIECSVYF